MRRGLGGDDFIRPQGGGTSFKDCLINGVGDRFLSDHMEGLRAVKEKRCFPKALRALSEILRQTKQTSLTRGLNWDIEKWPFRMGPSFRPRSRASS